MSEMQTTPHPKWEKGSGVTLYPVERAQRGPVKLHGVSVLMLTEGD